MKCSKGVCPETGDPKIMITIVDQNLGASWGLYCNYECAFKDTGNVLMHLNEGGNMKNIPQPEIAVNNGDNVADGDTPTVGLVLPEVNTTPSFDETWHPNMGYATELADSLCTVLHCDKKEHTVSNYILEGKTLKGRKIGLASNRAIIELAKKEININFQNPDYIVTIDPAVADVATVVKLYSNHIKAAIDMQNIEANTSPF